MNIGLGFLASARPQDGPVPVVDFEHVLPRLSQAVSENSTEDHDDVRHQVYRVVEDDHPPGSIQLDLRRRPALGQDLATIQSRCYKHG